MNQFKSKCISREGERKWRRREKTTRRKDTERVEGGFFVTNTNLHDGMRTEER